MSICKLSCKNEDDLKECICKPEYKSEKINIRFLVAFITAMMFSVCLFGAATVDSS